MNDDLNILKINYENEIKLRKDKYSIKIDNLNEKFKKLENFFNFKTIKKLEQIEKEYNETLKKLEFKKKMKENENLLLINSIIKNTQEIYGDNYYNNYNINNIINGYYKSEDPYIKNLFKNEDEMYNQLINKEEEKPKFKIKYREIDKLKIENSEKINIIKTLKDQNEIIKNENNEKTNIIKILKDENEKLKNRLSKKYICKNKTDKCEGYGFLCNISNSVLIVPDNLLKKEDIEIGKEITIIINNSKIIKKIIIDESRNIYIIDKLDDKEANIT